MKIRKFNESLKVDKEYIEDLFLVIEDLNNVSNVVVYPFLYKDKIISYQKEDFKNSEFDINQFKNGWRVDIYIKHYSEYGEEILENGDINYYPDYETEEYAFDLNIHLNVFNEIKNIQDKIKRFGLNISNTLKAQSLNNGTCMYSVSILES